MDSGPVQPELMICIDKWILATVMCFLFLPLVCACVYVCVCVRTCSYMCIQCTPSGLSEILNAADP